MSSLDNTTDTIPPDNSVEACKAALEKYGVLPADKLIRYMHLLLDWNEKINLTGAKNADELALKHVVDVWAALNSLEHPSKDVFDVGSGGGIPGIILAIISPGTKVTLVERRQKKAGVLSDIVNSLGLKDQIRVVPKSFEEIKNIPDEAEFWFRGFLPGPKLAPYLSRFFPRAELGQIVLMKGPGWSQEKDAIMETANVNQVWRERFAVSGEVHYQLPDGAGERVLVLL